MRKDREGRWQRITLYTHHDRAALYRADKATWQQMRLHEAKPDLAAYQELQLQRKDNVVCTQMYDGEEREYQREWAHGVPLLVCRGLSMEHHKKAGARGEGLHMMWRQSMSKLSSSIATSCKETGSRSMWHN